MSIIRLELDKAQYQKVIKALRNVEGKYEENVYKSAANKTATRAKRILETQNKRIYGGPHPEGISGRSRKESAKSANPTATLIFKSEQPDIKKFRHIGGDSHTKTVYSGGKRVKFPIYVQQLKSGAMKLVQNEFGLGFAVTFKSGHTAIVTHTGQRTKSGKERLKTWMGSSDMATVRNEKVYGQKEAQLQNIFIQECERALQKALG